VAAGRNARSRSKWGRRGRPVRILLVNAFHYLKGGVERTYLDESRWLKNAGHDVAHLAIEDGRNLESPTAAHFAPAADFSENVSAWRQIAQLPRAIWSAPAAAAMTRVVREFRPEIAHVHAPSRYLTPSVLRALEDARVPVIMTLHDFKPWCTNRILFAHGEPCERCKGGSHWHALTTACVQDSRAKSAVGMIEAYAHQALDAYRNVKLWIAPSRFVNDKAIEFGVAAGQLRLLPHGVELPTSREEPTGASEAEEPLPNTFDSRQVDGTLNTPSSSRAGASASPDRFSSPYVLFSGRLSVEKGVNLLPEIARAIQPTKLIVAGEGPLRANLETAAKDIPTLRVLGHLEDDELAAYRRQAAAVLVPSLFYEHFCYAVAEALLDERPVVAARIGAIPELIEHEVTGQLATPGDAPALANALRRAIDDAAAKRWAAHGAERVRRVADPAKHIEGLLAIYREAMGESR
jgi:glycosyltransferase involved in cell wall biosynthesis